MQQLLLARAKVVAPALGLPGEIKGGETPVSKPPPIEPTTIGGVTTSGRVPIPAATGIQPIIPETIVASTERRAIVANVPAPTSTIVATTTPKKLSEVRYDELTEEQKSGVIAWKRGWLHKLKYPPYEEEDIINSKDPIPGVLYHDDYDSAYESMKEQQSQEVRLVPVDTEWGEKPIYKTVSRAKQRVLYTEQQENKPSGIISSW